jgi:hypothetical protein
VIVDNFTLTGIVTIIVIAIFLLASGNRTKTTKSPEIPRPQKQPSSKN